MAEQPHEEVTTTEARAGASNTGVRYVLIISLVLVIAAFAAMMFIWR